MVKSDKEAANHRSGIVLPGQPTEEAVAEVGSAAGKSLIRGLERLGGAWISKWTASQEARAEAARVAIETNSEVEKQKSLTTARRVHEVDELEHSAALERRAVRLRRELAREQLNLEAVEVRALELIEADPLREKPREIDDDWLSRFADLAQKVSDKDIQELWARVLASAAVDDKKRVSPAALQLLALMDREVAEQFFKFCSVEILLGSVPANGSIGYQDEPLAIDPFLLSEAGLVTQVRVEARYKIFGARIGRERDGAMSCWGATARGGELYRAAIKGREMKIPPEILLHYAKRILSDFLEWSEAVIIPVEGNVLQRPIVVVKRDQEPVGQPWIKSPHEVFNEELAGLLQWAGEKYDLRFRLLSGDTGLP